MAAGATDRVAGGPRVPNVDARQCHAARTIVNAARRRTPEDAGRGGDCQADGAGVALLSTPTWPWVCSPGATVRLGWNQDSHTRTWNLLTPSQANISAPTLVQVLIWTPRPTWFSAQPARPESNPDHRTGSSQPMDQRKGTSMLKLFVCCVICGLLPLAAGCSREAELMTPGAGGDPAGVDPELVAGEIVLAGGWEIDPVAVIPAALAEIADKRAPAGIRDFNREMLTGDIVHYEIVISVGPGEHDVIGLHRVVRERNPYNPVRTPRAMFLVHGMGKDFVGNFLPGAKSPLLPDDRGFAVYMAQHGIDVWGIDNSYTLVPTGLEDFGFAAEWGMDKCVRDIGTGLAVARTARLFTGNGLRKMILMGYSQGAIMGYAVVNREAQMPPLRRNVAAFIPVDWGLAFDDPEVQAAECPFLSGYRDLWDQGVYGFYDDPDGFYASVGTLAQTEPSGPSPYYEGFTNLEVFMFFTATAAPPYTSHYWGASFTDDGVPVDFLYTTQLMATEFWIRWAPMHPPTRQWADLYEMNCEDSVWESHLGAVNLPVFSLEAAGGSGPGMASTLARLTSAVVTRHVVRLQAPQDAYMDFGHVDLFTAENAAELAWQPTLDWVMGLDAAPALPAPTVEPALSAADIARLRALGRDAFAVVGPYGYRHDAPAVTASPVKAPATFEYGRRAWAPRLPAGR